MISSSLEYPPHPCGLGLQTTHDQHTHNTSTASARLSSLIHSCTFGYSAFLRPPAWLPARTSTLPAPCSSLRAPGQRLHDGARGRGRKASRAGTSASGRSGVERVGGGVEGRSTRPTEE